jgi:hypothetical protein
MNQYPEPRSDVPPPRSFWVKALGAVLLVSSVGLVSCQSLFAL